MKWGKFVLGLAAGVAASYLVNKYATKPSSVNPEKVIQTLKNRYKKQMSIVGSWIHVEPKIEEVNGIPYNTYQGGLTGMLEDGTPKFLEFVVDADTGTLLKVDS